MLCGSCNVAAIHTAVWQFSCVITEFRHAGVSWDDVVPGEQRVKEDPLWREVYVWPMLLAEQRAGNKLLVRQPFTGGVSLHRGMSQDGERGE